MNVEKIPQAEDSAQTLAKARTGIGGIAHDFNNLLMVIIGGLSILDGTPPATGLISMNMDLPAILSSSRSRIRAKEWTLKPWPAASNHSIRRKV
jgi:hypothetical protein